MWLAEYSKDIVLHNPAKGIPVKESSVDVIYHFHLLEHLIKDDAKGFMKACLTNLVSGGRVRVVVPDFKIFCE